MCDLIPRVLFYSAQHYLFSMKPDAAAIRTPSSCPQASIFLFFFCGYNVCSAPLSRACCLHHSHQLSISSSLLSNKRAQMSLSDWRASRFTWLGLAPPTSIHTHRPLYRVKFKCSSPANRVTEKCIQSTRRRRAPDARRC